jgi:hypothetical protein
MKNGSPLKKGKIANSSEKPSGDWWWSDSYSHQLDFSTDIEIVKAAWRGGKQQHKACQAFQR